MAKANTLDSVLARINKSSGHWFWMGYCNKDGYGVVKWHGHAVKVHRLMYQTYVGPIPPRFDVDHIQDDGLCGIRNCCNPEHLRAVTHRYNVYHSTSFVVTKANQTHCVNGHRFTEKNTMIRKNTTRACRICKSIRDAAYRARKRAEREAERALLHAAA